MRDPLWVHTDMTLHKVSEMSSAQLLSKIRELLNLSPSDLSQILGASLVSVIRWERGDTQPSPETAAKIQELYRKVRTGNRPERVQAITSHTFASRGARTAITGLPLFEPTPSATVRLTSRRQRPVIQRLKRGDLWGDGERTLATLLAQYGEASPTLASPGTSGISAGKNTYTYDAHTYHTKVPPQGIAEVLKQYLPEGGLVLDPFAGSGMTGVAARTLGHDVILNELSPAASFIADHFTRRIDPQLFAAGVRAIIDATAKIRKELYSTTCRECGKAAELQYTVWSYRVRCPACDGEFLLWDHCRSYGRTVREHKILSEFACPCCKTIVMKKRLQRTVAVPVLVGYRCCRRMQMEHAPSQADLLRIDAMERDPPVAEGDYPTLPLPDGVNLNQPKRHGLTSVDRLYTGRNLAAMSHLWRSIHHVSNPELAGYLGFAFTSLYQRVTRLSEFRFWGGSGNTANYNVPFIFNEANVFATFERKARAIQDHLETTARHYRGRCVVRTGSATQLDWVPDNSVDLVFTDPPFGKNINYSEMNILWESWLGEFTDVRHEAIVNKFQGKDARTYGSIMLDCLKECHRVLRPDHWLILVFMNSAEEIWQELRRAITKSGFSLERIDIFDKQHGTFKQFVSNNTAGCDLILHCRKGEGSPISATVRQADANVIWSFLRQRPGQLPKLPYLHVEREEEIDYRMLYSEWLKAGLLGEGGICDFASFRTLASMYLEEN